MALMLRRPGLLTQAHPQVGTIRKIKIHVQGVGSPRVIIGKEVIQG